MSPDNKRMEQCIKFVDGANTVTLCLRGPLASPTIKSWYLDSFYTPQTGSDWTKIVRPTYVSGLCPTHPRTSVG
ncbi:uncharacterized protein L969DRAFT_88138 [Mixia osmundae IAM 14324]|uniref:uncharacterized protein n=1 Tax=Mixia osmundae (strain CBS 9802 / IAM 14324 / JCM 22182 / KY 12970) TaxID=764103 RepID=UPI0004A553F3|nr:uncharacterized protein L969DRAFT_88138 [Mixia osmundae IAM 14324]KEI38810.1 hypothetical protein L969DRAFT_88138 [Mixia osmundae IAM 14324]